MLRSTLTLAFATVSTAALAQAAPQAAVEANTIGAPVATSLLDLFLEATLVVKIVMVGLVVASVWCWAIVFDRWRTFARARKAIDRFEDNFWGGGNLEDMYRTLSERKPIAMGALFVAAMKEWKTSFTAGARSPIGLQTRIDKQLDVALGREMERLEKRLLFLATLGSAAPFVGLFGTVIGIMNSFQAIAGSQSTNLAVVAPGIAEALLATALGLLAAIPAVIFYNKFSADAAKLGARMEAFADEFSAILSRQIDERAPANTNTTAQTAGRAA